MEPGQLTASLRQTKLHSPPTRLELIPRPHRIGRLNDGSRRTAGVARLSAPAGSGKIARLSERQRHSRPNSTPQPYSKLKPRRKLHEVLWQLSQGMQSLSQGMQSLSQGMQSLSQRMQSLSQGMQSLSQGMQGLCRFQLGLSLVSIRSYRIAAYCSCGETAASQAAWRGLPRPASSARRRQPGYLTRQESGPGTRCHTVHLAVTLAALWRYTVKHLKAAQ
jgi:hypothetical protein